MITVDQKARFLNELSVTGNVGFACRAAGVERRAMYALRHGDHVFGGLWRRAVDVARTALEERMRNA